VPAGWLLPAAPHRWEILAAEGVRLDEEALRTLDGVGA
jgi:hypothetical protein